MENFEIALTMMERVKVCCFSSVLLQEMSNKIGVDKLANISSWTHLLQPVLVILLGHQSNSQSVWAINTRNAHHRSQWLGKVDVFNYPIYTEHQNFAPSPLVKAALNIQWDLCGCDC